MVEDIQSCQQGRFNIHISIATDKGFFLKKISGIKFMFMRILLVLEGIICLCSESSEENFRLTVVHKL